MKDHAHLYYIFFTHNIVTMILDLHKSVSSAQPFWYETGSTLVRIPHITSCSCFHNFQHSQTMASASLPDFLPPSTGGPTEQMKSYVKLLVQTAQTGVVTDFYNYLQHNPVNESFDIKARVLEFTTKLETSTKHREQANNFLFAQYDAKGYHRTGRWLQCAYCKIWYPRHMTMPMIPAADVDNWHLQHHNFCFSCTRSSLDNQLLHPGNWLNVQPPPDIHVGEHTQLQPGTPDLTQTGNRPTVLLTLDQENNPESWVPHHWTLALPTTADVTYDAFILHYWDTTQLRWFRTPLANPKSDQYEQPRPLTLDQFLNIATKVWKKREQYSRQEFTERPRMAVYKNLVQQAKDQNPAATNSHIRRITANQLAFISSWSSHSVYHMDPKHRDQFLKALTSWHEAHAEQALTGEHPLKAYIQSTDFTEHLKEWWDAITPSLYNHFLCRNPNCKSVILNSHWLRTMDNNSPKQGQNASRHTDHSQIAHTTRTLAHWSKPNSAWSSKFQPHTVPTHQWSEDNNWLQQTLNTLTIVSSCNGLKQTHNTC